MIKVLLLISMLLLTNPLGAQKEKTYVVQPGDSVAKIADHFGVSQTDLVNANDLSNPPDLRPGQELIIPDELRRGSRGHVIKEGDTLVRIAKRFKVSVEDIKELNKLGDSEPLTLGRTLLIPGTQSAVRSKVGEGTTKRQPVAILRVHTGQSAKVFLTTKGGAVNQKGRRALSVLAASKSIRIKNSKRIRKGRVVDLHPRLVRLLAEVAERYTGRTILITSGYRPHRGGKSRSKHSQGRALDFRVEGVSNGELYEFIKTLPKTGTGYYPNSTFVHLDARDRSYTWIDYSGPNEPPRYAKPGVVGDPEAIADAESAAEEQKDSDESMRELIELSPPSPIQIAP